MKLTKRLSVLYAENNEDARHMLSTLLSFSDIDVSLARSIEEAFQAAQERDFDLYLLDSSLPDGSGFDLCRQLRKIKPQTPIVFYTGDAREADKEQGLAAGANAYLFKPDVETVIPTIFELVTQTLKNAD